MRKLRFVLIFAALAALLTACGGTKPEESWFSVGQLQAVVEAGAFSEELEELDGDVAFALYHLADYGLTRETLTDCAVLRSAGATCEEGAVLIFSDQESAQTALSALNDYLEDQVDSNTNYRPQEIPKLESALLEQRGSTVALVVAADADAARTALGL